MSLFAKKDRTATENKKSLAEIKADLLATRNEVEEAANYSGIIFNYAKSVREKVLDIQKNLLRMRELAEIKKKTFPAIYDALLQRYKVLASSAEVIDDRWAKALSFFIKLENLHPQEKLNERQKEIVIQRISGMVAELKYLERELWKILKELESKTWVEKIKSLEFAAEAEKEKAESKIAEIHRLNRGLRRATLMFPRYGQKMASLLNNVLERLRKILSKYFQKF